MGNKSNPPRRHGNARGLWYLVWGATLPAPVIRGSKVYLLEQPRMRYCARACKLFPGEWRAEPVNYTGRGVVYLFHGADAQLEAETFAADKNRRDGFE